MRELQQKQKAKQRLYSLPVLGALTVVLLLIMNGTYNVWKKKHESSLHVIELQTRVESLKARELELQANISRLQTDDGIDTEIKKKYSVSKEGEHVVVIVDPKTATTTIPIVKKAWYQRLWDGIIH